MYMGGKIQALSYQEIKAWLDLSELTLTYNEIKAIKQLSNEFVGAYHDGSSEYAVPPYSDKPLGDKLKMALSSYKK